MRAAIQILILITLSLMLAACGAQSPAATPTVPVPTTESMTDDADMMETEESSNPTAPQNQTVAYTFYDSHAVWCNTCRINEPLISDLTTQYAGQIQFIRVDVDNPADTATRERFGLVDRSMYALVGANGEVVKRWFGILNETRVITDINEVLAG